MFQRFKNNPAVRYTQSYFKRLYQRTLRTNSQLKHGALQFLPFLLASVLTGFVAFLYSRLFAFSEHLSFKIFEKNPLFIFVATPVTFLLSWWLVRRFAPYSKGSGIPQVMASIELSKPQSYRLVRHFLSLKIIVVKIISSGVKVIGGGILGREGPTIQIAAAIFNQVHKWLPKWWQPVSQKNVLIAGAASGLAAAFNTPLGGIIFAIEELSKFHIKYYKSPLFVAVVIAGLTAQTFGGSYLYLGYPKTVYSGWMVVFALLMVAVVAGYFGSKMCWWLLRFMKILGRIKSTWKSAGVVAILGLFVATFIYFIGVDAMGSGKEIMERTLFTDAKTVDWYLPFVRVSGLISSFSFGGAGGIFAPSLSAGASFGAVVAEAFSLDGSNANLVILVGMTAFLTGVTRAPFTSAIIILEMTDRHSIIFFLLLGSVLANVVASFVSKHSFYDILKENYIREVTT